MREQPSRVGTALSGYKEIDERIFVGKVVYSTGTSIGRNSNYSKGLPGTNNGMWARSAHNLPRSGGSKPEGLARGCEAPERAKRAEPEGLVKKKAGSSRLWHRHSSASDILKHASNRPTECRHSEAITSITLRHCRLEHVL